MKGNLIIINLKDMEFIIIQMEAKYMKGNLKITNVKDMVYIMN